MPQIRQKRKSWPCIEWLDAARDGERSVPTGASDFIRERATAWRREIVQARIRLVDEGLTRAQRVELWRVVDCREWCLRMLAVDFPAEMEAVDREIEDALRRR